MTNAFCPQCKQVQEIREFFDGVNEVVRCRVCGSHLAGGTVVDPVPPEVEAASTVPAPPFVATVPAAPTRQPTLLIVDDDKIVLGFLRDIARAHDLLPIIAADGSSGIALAKQEQPDLIILDVMMPSVDGWEVCRQMREVPELKHTPILILTALEDPANFAKGMKVGATFTMEKTLDSEQLLKMIKTLLTAKPQPPTATTKTFSPPPRKSIFPKVE